MVSDAELFPQDAEDLERLDVLDGMARSGLLDELRGRVDAHRQSASRLELRGEPSVSAVFMDKADALEMILARMKQPQQWGK